MEWMNMDRMVEFAGVTFLLRLPRAGAIVLITYCLSINYY